MDNIKLLSTFFLSAFITISCNNNTQQKSNDAATQTATTKTDSSKYTLSMVDNKKDLSCGMPLTAGIGDTAHYNGKVYGFCSDECKEAFMKNPDSCIAAGK